MIIYVYRLYITENGTERLYGSSTYDGYMLELINDYVRTNGSTGDKFSFRIECIVREK